MSISSVRKVIFQGDPNYIIAGEHTAYKNKAIERLAVSDHLFFTNIDIELILLVFRLQYKISVWRDCSIFSGNAQDFAPQRTLNSAGGELALVKFEWGHNIHRSFANDAT